jgi:E1A/CREB-binding protein
MVTSIAKLLQARKPNAPTEWMKKLPQMARRLEESLFKGAPSFDEYRDQDTLKKRLQKLALDMGIRAREQTQSGGGAAPTTSSNAGAGGNGDGGNNSGNYSNGDESQNSNSQGGQPNGQPQTAQAAQPSQQTQEQRQQVLRQQQQRLLLLRHASKCPHGEANEAVNADNHSEGARVKRGPGWKWGDQDGGAGNSGVLGKKKTNGWTLVTWEKTMEEREYRIGGEGAFDLEFGGCPVTQHCAGMRKLWKHIAECKDQQCQTPHCVSSRYVLSHYHRCRERGCAVCQPVREAIQRNHEKARELEAARQKQISGRAQGGAGGQGGAKKSKKGEHGGGAGKRPNGQANGQAKGGAQGAAAGGGGGGAARLPAPPPMGYDANAELQRKQPQQKKSPDPNTSMIYTFTTAQIQAHIESLAKPMNLKPSVSSTGDWILRNEKLHSLEFLFCFNTILVFICPLFVAPPLTSGCAFYTPPPPYQAIRTRCTPVLKKLMDAEYGWIFKQPVDPVDLNLPDYFDVVKKPMDLGTVKKKLDNSVYRDIDEFIGDVRLVFDNAILYNGNGLRCLQLLHRGVTYIGSFE